MGPLFKTTFGDKPALLASMLSPHWMVLLSRNNHR